MNFLEMNGLQTAQTHFKDIFRDNIHRDYADAMLDWLERETDFFTAPSSTKYHGAHPGGLLVHSLNVYYRLRDIAIRDLADKEDPGKRRLSEEQEETVAIIALPPNKTADSGCLHSKLPKSTVAQHGILPVPCKILIFFRCPLDGVRVIHDTQRKEDTWGPRRTICSRNSVGVFLLRCGPTRAGAYAARRRRRRKHSANVLFARLQGITP